MTTMTTPTAHTLTRDTSALQIPYGEKIVLPAGTPVYLTQTLGGSYTVQAPSYGGLYRIAGKDADALGLTPPESAEADAGAKPAGPVDEAAVWDLLKTCYDPEIPVNIVDLGLVYDLQVDPQPKGGSKVTVKMTLTAPGCGMGPSIASDARNKVEALPGVSEADVQLVWDPPWSAEMMSPAAKKQLGFPG